MSRHWGKSIRTIFANHAIYVRHPASAPAALMERPRPKELSKV